MPGSIAATRGAASAASAASRSPATSPVLSTPAPAAIRIPQFTSIERQSSEHLELVIGRRWIGLAAIALIVVATAFFLKYAFENRWIGELGGSRSVWRRGSRWCGRL